MKVMTSISGGQTSAYVAANYPSEFNVFSLVRIEDENCKFKDDVYRRKVEDKIQKPFIGTAEDDTIIYTLFELEQFLGKEIIWVTGDTFDSLIDKRKGYLPNIMTRYCTTHLKLEPIFNWWKDNVKEKIITQIGYRANESKRANKMLSKCDEEGFSTFKTVVGKMKNGNNKWEHISWQKPSFPLIESNILKKDIQNFWANKPVKFAPYNNCVGCFNRNPVFLRWQFQEHPEKMQWFADKEKITNAFWKSENGQPISYERIKNMLPQLTLYENDFTSCDSGYCEL